MVKFNRIIKSRFLGDEYYLESESNTAQVEVIKQSPDITLRLEDGEFHEGDTPTLFISSNLEELAPVTVKLNNVVYGDVFVDSDGNAELSVELVYGVNNFRASSPETPVCIAGLSNTASIDTSKSRTIITLEVLKLEGTSLELKAILTKTDNTRIENKALIISLDGENYNRNTNNNGEVIINHNFSHLGEFPIMAIFNGDEDYFSTSKDITVNVSKIVPRLGALNSSLYRGHHLKIKATNQENQPIANATVTISINGPIYTLTTDNNGVVKLPIELLRQFSPYSYTATISGANIRTTSMTGTVELKNPLTFECKPARDGMVSQREASNHRGWTFDWLSSNSNDPYAASIDEQFMRCGKTCRDNASIGSRAGSFNQPASLYHSKFNFQDLPDMAFIDAIEVVYIHRYMVCGNARINVGAGTVSIDNYMADTGGSIHIEKKGANTPGAGSWVQNNVVFDNPGEIHATLESLKQNKLRVGLKYDRNSTYNTGRLDVGWVSVKIYYSPKEEE